MPNNLFQLSCMQEITSRCRLRPPPPARSLLQSHIPPYPLGVSPSSSSSPSPSPSQVQLEAAGQWEVQQVWEFPLGRHIAYLEALQRNSMRGRGDASALSYQKIIDLGHSVEGTARFMATSLTSPPPPPLRHAGLPSRPRARRLLLCSSRPPRCHHSGTTAICMLW